MVCQKQKNKRDFSNFSEQRFVDGFANKNMDFLNNTNISLNSKFDLFYDTVSSYVDNHVPVKKINKKDLKLHSKPWVNPKIQRLIKYCDKLLHKLNRLNFLHNTEYLYKKFRNRIVNELRSSKIKHYNQYLTNDKSNMKKLWSGIESIINIKNNRLHTISQIVHNGQVIN